MSDTMLPIEITDDRGNSFLLTDFQQVLDLKRIVKSAQSLFDNRLGWSEGRNPYAPREFWANLSSMIYGEDDLRTKELRVFR